MKNSRAFLLTLIAVVGYSSGTQQAAHSEDAPQIVKITAKKFTYTPDQVTVKKGVPVVLQLTSADRQHGISIPSLNLRSDIPPGKTTELKFTPQKTGDIRFYCDVFCGDGHDNMEGTLKVQ